MGTGPGKLVLDLFPELKNSDSSKKKQIIHEYLQAYHDNMTKNTTVYPGVFDFLDQWQGQLALVTNKPEFLAKPLMEKFGFNKYSWVTQIGGDSLSEKKPHPLPLIKSMETAGVNNQQTVMIGDGFPDVEAAQNANIPCIAVSYGYSPVNELLTAGAYTSINSIFELSNVLSNLFKLD